MSKDGSAADVAAHMGCRSITGSSGLVAARTGQRTWNQFAGIATGGSMQESPEPKAETAISEVRAVNPQSTCQGRHALCISLICKSMNEAADKR
jgi:hypothetical protein